MKAISVRQPWAWLIIHGGKDIENRTWPTKFRGRVLVHAAKGTTDQEYIDGWRFAYRAKPDLETDSVPELIRRMAFNLDRGGIIGSVEIVDCVSVSDSPWFSGPFGFVLRDPVSIEFRPLRGKLGFFDVPLEAMCP